MTLLTGNCICLTVDSSDWNEALQLYSHIPDCSVVFVLSVFT